MSEQPTRIVKIRRTLLKPGVNWANRHLSQRKIEWIAAHSFGWLKTVPRPVRIPGTRYAITDVKWMDWVKLADWVDLGELGLPDE